MDPIYKAFGILPRLFLYGILQSICSKLYLGMNTRMYSPLSDSLSLGTIFYVFALTLSTVSCQSDFLPKPMGYNRIDLPDPTFLPLEENLPYQFEYSRHAQVEPDRFNPEEKNWINLHYPSGKRGYTLPTNPWTVNGQPSKPTWMMRSPSPPSTK